VKEAKGSELNTAAAAHRAQKAAQTALLGMAACLVQELQDLSDQGDGRITSRMDRLITALQYLHTHRNVNLNEAGDLAFSTWGTVNVHQSR
jgi:hypothetical protein